MQVVYFEKWALVFARKVLKSGRDAEILTQSVGFHHFCLSTPILQSVDKHLQSVIRTLMIPEIPEIPEKNWRRVIRASVPEHLEERCRDQNHRPVIRASVPEHLEEHLEEHLDSSHIPYKLRL